MMREGEHEDGPVLHPVDHGVGKAAHHQLPLADPERGADLRPFTDPARGCLERIRQVVAEPGFSRS
jgi:hypothetical protein